MQKHFADFQEDQFDFHTYCARKSTLRAYMAMLRMQDTLFAHASYSKVPLLVSYVFRMYELGGALCLNVFHS